MQITLDIPDDLAASLIPAGADPTRTAMETFAVEAYRNHRLTEGEIRRLLGYETRMEVHALLKEHEVFLHYGLDNIDQDDETLRFLQSLHLKPECQTTG